MPALSVALKKEPERRYASVELMAEDVRRHLQGQPVSARPDTFAYRASKFARRHRVGVAATTAFGLMLMAFVVALALQQAATARERDRAQLEAAKAERVNAFLQEMLASADPSKEGRDVTVAEVLGAASERLDHELKEEPELLGALHHTLSTTCRNLGLYDEAEMHVRAALALREQAYGPAHPDVARTLHELGQLLYEKGSYDEAEEHLRRAIHLYEALVPADSLALAAGLDALAIVLNNKGGYEEAEQLYRQALALYRRPGRSLQRRPEAQSTKILAGKLRH